MKPVRLRDDPARDPREQIREDNVEFGRRAASSPCLRDWAFAVAEDPDVLALLGELPPAKQQPNLLFAAARWHGAAPVPYAAADGLRAVLLDRWQDVRATMLARATQTNEVGRCATLLPVLGGLTGPLALLEVGASAGLCLFPDRYSYRYSGQVEAALDPVDGPSPVVVECLTEGAPPVPATMPEVVWRRGIDLRPLDVRDDDGMRWLEHLVWPEHQDRRARLAAAVQLVRTDPPVLVTGDLVTDLPRLAAQAPSDATLVVFHSAVLAYLSESDREEFRSAVHGVIEHGGHWVSNEGPAVLPDLAATAPPPRAGSVVGTAPFLLALDGRAVAWTQGHGRAISWIGR